jgi:hypothetical protein
MSDTDAAWIEPMKDYLGFVCENCGRKFPVVKPLDPVEFPPERPLKIGARGGSLAASCTHCGHLADYPIGKLIRFCA